MNSRRLFDHLVSGHLHDQRHREAPSVVMSAAFGGPGQSRNCRRAFSLSRKSESVLCPARRMRVIVRRAQAVLAAAVSPPMPDGEQRPYGRHAVSAAVVPASPPHGSARRPIVIKWRLLVLLPAASYSSRSAPNGDLMRLIRIRAELRRTPGKTAGTFEDAPAGG